MSMLLLIKSCVIFASYCSRYWWCACIFRHDAWQVPLCCSFKDNWQMQLRGYGGWSMASILWPSKWDEPLCPWINLPCTPISFPQGKSGITFPHEIIHVIGDCSLSQYIWTMHFASSIPSLTLHGSWWLFVIIGKKGALLWRRVVVLLIKSRSTGSTKSGTYGQTQAIWRWIMITPTVIWEEIILGLNIYSTLFAIDRERMMPLHISKQNRRRWLFILIDVCKSDQ